MWVVGIRSATIDDPHGQAKIKDKISSSLRGPDANVWVAKAHRISLIHCRLQDKSLRKNIRGLRAEARTKTIGIKIVP